MTPRPASHVNPPTILVAFGTRPETIKLAPVIQGLTSDKDFRCVTVASGQHTDLVEPFIRLFGLKVDHTFNVMVPGQSLNQLLAKLVSEADRVLKEYQPKAVLVQGDTTTALAFGLAAFQNGIDVGHVEAGLRTADIRSPFPEEMNRRLITRLARWHFTATPNHDENLLRELVPATAIIRTGNTVVDAMQAIHGRVQPSPKLTQLLNETAGQHLLVVTMHRRENHDTTLDGYLYVLRRFVERHSTACVIFPVHPNPVVRARVNSALGCTPRVHLIDPLDYPDFLALMSQSWAIASDSGGVQEEAPSLGKPLFILRETTERPEVLDTGLATLCPRPVQLESALNDLMQNPRTTTAVANPFGDGQAAGRIVNELRRCLLPSANRRQEVER
jgi:UDP-N-acetylglucosamine 2-epimerase (non-hydrolysing)